MSLEVVTRFRRSNEDCIQQLVDLHVPDFGIVKDLTDVVHRMLTVRTLPGGGGSVAAISIGSDPGSSRAFTSSELSEVRAPTIAWSWGPAAASGDWDPAVTTAISSSIGPGS
jgi:hypothetical protein